MTTQAEQGVVVFDDRNGKIKDEETIGGLVTDNSSPKKNNRIGIADEAIKGKLRIRKLTPKECWRLQGWGFIREDGTWDDTAFEKAKASGVSDSQLYKQAGNGCSANVVMAIGLRLTEIEKGGEKND